MGRPTDWSPLTYTDPVPGDPVQVSASARHYRQTAEAIRTAADRLRQITDGTADARGQYIEAFRGKADGVADKVSKAEERYAQTAEALENYGPELEAAQDTADRALQRAKEAQEEARQWESSMPEWEGPIPGSPAAQGRDVDRQAYEDHQDARDRVQGRIDDSRAEIDRQREIMQGAVEDRDRAAERARSKIEDIITSDGLEDSGWDNFLQGLKAIADVAGVVATVCGVLALAVGWIPVIGQALAAVLGTIALVAGIVSLAANVVLAANGEATWGDVAWSAVGVLTFGVGRAAGAAVRLGRSGARLLGRASQAMPSTSTVLSTSTRSLAGQMARNQAGIRQAARGTWSSGRQFARQGYANAFRGPTGFRSNVDTVWQGLRNPSTIRHPGPGAAHNPGANLADGGWARPQNWWTAAREANGLTSPGAAGFAEAGAFGVSQYDLVTNNIPSTVDTLDGR